MSHELRVQNCIERLKPLSNAAEVIGLFHILGGLLVLVEDPKVDASLIVETLERATVEAEAYANRGTGT